MKTCQFCGKGIHDSDAFNSDEHGTYHTDCYELVDLIPPPEDVEKKPLYHKPGQGPGSHGY